MPALPFLVAALTPAFFGVHWTSLQHHALTVKGYGFEQGVTDCLDSSREAKIRYEMKLCRRRTGWFDTCVQPRVENHSIAFDSITESFRVVADRHGDEAGPITVGIPSRAEAVAAMITVEEIPLTLLSRDQTSFLSEGRRYVQVRGVLSCKGRVNRMIAGFSQILTLGLLDLNESHSGWFDFDLDGGVANQT